MTIRNYLKLRTRLPTAIFGVGVFAIDNARITILWFALGLVLLAMVSIKCPRCSAQFGYNLCQRALWGRDRWVEVCPHCGVDLDEPMQDVRQ